MMVQDWGRPIGLGVAFRYLERFRALIIGNTGAWPVNGDRHFEWFSKLLGGGGVAIRNLNALVNLRIPAGVARDKTPKEAMAAYRGPFTEWVKEAPYRFGGSPRVTSTPASFDHPGNSYRARKPGQEVVEVSP
jgi:hypothetical protein